MSKSLLPPRKSEWRQGTTQIGLFIRTTDGHVVEVSSLVAEDEAKSAYELLRLLSRPAAERTLSEATLAAIADRASKKASRT